MIKIDLPYDSHMPCSAQVPQLVESPRLADYKERLRRAVQCPICLERCSTCYTSNACGHSICQQCAETCVNERDTCPFCRRQLTGFVRNYAMEHVIDLIDGLSPRKPVCGHEDCTNQSSMLACDVCLGYIPRGRHYRRHFKRTETSDQTIQVTCLECT